MPPGVLLDSGAARIHHSHSQVPRSLSSFYLSTAVSDMNSSNLGDLNPGYSSSAHNAQQNMSFNTPSVSRSSSSKGISRPRLVKVRKQSNVLNLKPGGESRIAPGFNPFLPEAAQAGPRLSSSNLDLEKGFGNLNIGTGSEFLNSNSNAGDGGGFVFGSDHSKSSGSNSNIDDNMKKLNINEAEKVVDGRSNLNSDHKAKFGFPNVDASSIGKTTEEPALSKESKTKINAGETEGSSGGSDVFGTDNVKNVEVKSSEKGGHVVDEIKVSALRDRVKNLSIKNFVNAGPANDKINLKDGFTFGIKESTNCSVGGDRENISSSEMGCKSNVGSAMREHHSETGMTFSSSGTLGKDFQTANGGDKKFPDYDIASKRFGPKGGALGKHATGVQGPTDQPEVIAQTNSVPGPSFVFSNSSGLTGGKAFGMPPSGRHEKMDEFSFMSKKDDVGSPFVGFKTAGLKGNIFSGSNQKVEFIAKPKDLKGKKKRGKLKQPTKVHLWPGPHEIPEATESYSPMDASPYQETFSDTQISRETSVASEESFSQDNQCASTDSQTAVLDDAIGEGLVSAAEQMDINAEDPKCIEVPEESSDHCFGANIGAENPIVRCLSGFETESFKSANEEIESINDIGMTLGDNEVSSSSNIQRQDSDIKMQFFSAASSDDIGGSGFTFAASSTAKSSGNHLHKKKNWSNIGRHSFSSCPNAKDQYASSSLQFSQVSPTSLPSSPTRVKKAGLSTACVVGDNTNVLRSQEIKQQSDLAGSASIAAQEACEKWRLRGNQAYTGGDLSKAEDCYTKGINSVSKSETSRSCLRALMLCYSNRAATLMSLGRMRDALGDCKMAAAIDPTFLRVQVRAANCYLALGEVEEASEYFKKCMHLGTDGCVDRKIAVEASEGLQKAQKVSEYMQHSSELLQKKTSNDAELALEVIAGALLISSYSEKLLEMKAESLLLLRKYEDVVQLCEQTFDSAKKNSFPLDADDHLENLNGSKLEKDNLYRLWRTCLIFKSYFYLGKLEEAIGSVERQQELDSVTKSETMESLIPLVATVRELLHHKTAGNEAFQAGRHSDAIEHYTAALSRSIESRPFAAICFCNRAAAYKALGQVIDAIADCSLAIALDGNYLKAISRRATLYEMIRDYGQASNDLQRLVAVLMKQVEEKTNQFDRSSNLTNDLRQARMRLSTIEEESRKETPLNMYLILGIEPSASASEIRKAYRKAALRHHPDKAGQSLTRSENGDDGLWKEIGEEVHKDADRLFKMIGEAYAVLSDTNKRSQYDQEEEIRKKRNGNSNRSYTDTWNHPFESNSARRQWREVWRSHGR